MTVSTKRFSKSDSEIRKRWAKQLIIDAILVREAMNGSPMLRKLLQQWSTMIVDPKFPQKRKPAKEFMRKWKFIINYANAGNVDIKDTDWYSYSNLLKALARPGWATRKGVVNIVTPQALQTFDPYDSSSDHIFVEINLHASLDLINVEIKQEVSRVKEIRGISDKRIFPDIWELYLEEYLELNESDMIEVKFISKKFPGKGSDPAMKNEYEKWRRHIKKVENEIKKIQEEMLRDLAS